ncbi:MAG TPA: phosphatase PAP2 family protein [Acidimicrobiia bacterium]|nr:phosphatase PAP2 family protein [Acidimicrobiia bacterium]
MLITFVLYQVYSAIRNLSEGSTRVAYRHARQLMEWQAAIGINHEETLQQWALNSRPLIILMNYIYGSLHFIVTAGAVVYLYRRFPGEYPRWRNTLALTTILALIGFIFWPLMPPRLLYTVAPGQYDFVDTLARYPTFWSFDSGAINKISNQYAAMPSLHFGWSLFCAAALAPRVRRRAAKVAAALYPLLTLAAIVLTANHFVLDAAGGAVVFLAGWWLARRFTRPGPVLTDPAQAEAVGPVPPVPPTRPGPDATEGEAVSLPLRFRPLL